MSGVGDDLLRALRTTSTTDVVSMAAELLAARAELKRARVVAWSARLLLKALDPRDYLSESDDLDDALDAYYAELERSPRDPA